MRYIYIYAYMLKRGYIRVYYFFTIFCLILFAHFVSTMAMSKTGPIIKKFCIEASCGVPVSRTDPHDACFLHRNCTRIEPCSYCTGNTSTDWDSVEKRKSALAARRAKEKQIRKSESMALKDSVACQRDSVSDTSPVHDKGLSTPVESVPCQLQREEQASSSLVNLTPTSPVAADQSVLLNNIFTLLQANCNTMNSAALNVALPQKPLDQSKVYVQREAIAQNDNSAVRLNSPFVRAESGAIFSNRQRPDRRPETGTGNGEPGTGLSGARRLASDFIEPGTGYRHPETGYREPHYDYRVPTSGNRRPATVNRQSVIDDWDRQLYKDSTVHERTRPLGYDGSPDDLVTSESELDTVVNPFTIGSDRERINSFRWDEESRDLGRRSKSLDFSAQHSRKRKRVDFSPSENSDEQVKDSHDDSEIPFVDIIQGVSDSLNLPLTSTAIKPSKKPSACLGSDGENTENKALPLSPWLAAIWKDLDNDLKGSNPSGMPMEKGKFFKRHLKSEKVAFKDHSFPLTAQKLQASVEGIVSSQSKFSPNIDFKSMTDFSNDMRTSVALTNNALLLTATRELILKEMFSMLDFSSLPDRFTDLFETTEVLIREAKKDFGRSVTAQTRILANMELFRRDSVLDKVNKRVSKASVNSLRSSTLLSSSMFEDSIVKEVQDSTERSIRFGTSTPSTRSFSRTPSTGARSRFTTPTPSSEFSSFRGSFRGRAPRARGGRVRGRGNSRGRKFTAPGKQ